MHLSWTIILTWTYAHAQVFYPRISSRLPSLAGFRANSVYDNYPEWPTFSSMSPFMPDWEDGRESLLSIPINDPLKPFGRTLPEENMEMENLEALNQKSYGQLGTEIKPPPYYKSLEYFENVTNEIKKRLNIRDNTPNNPFITFVYVIQRLAQEAVENGWRYYEINYRNLVQTFINKAYQYPQFASRQVNCILDKYHETIKLIQKLLTNKWENYLCEVPLGFDILIDSFVKIIAEEKLYREAVLLLLLGKESASYLSVNPQLFDSFDKNELFRFFMVSEDLVGRYYEINYRNLVQTFINKAYQYPQFASRQVNCILDKYHETIKLIQKLLTNKWENYLCEVPLGFDILIDSFVKIIAEEKLYREAVLLLLLGKESASYLSVNPQLFDSFDKNELFRFFMVSEDLVGSVMYTSAMIRQTNSSRLAECDLVNSVLFTSITS